MGVTVKSDRNEHSYIQNDDIFCCVSSGVQTEQNLLEEHVGLFPALNRVTESEKTDEDVFKYLLDVELQLRKGYFPNGMRNAGAVRRIGKGKSKLGRVTSARQEASLYRH